MVAERALLIEALQVAAAAVRRQAGRGDGRAPWTG
jgi:hypothetical protein